MNIHQHFDEQMDEADLLIEHQDLPVSFHWVVVYGVG